MDICINTDKNDAELEEPVNLVCNNGLDKEIGYLKINPERVPSIFLEEDAESAIQRFDKHKVEFTLKGNRYILITDDRAVSYSKDGSIQLFGNGYLVRKQKEKYTGLTMRELNEILVVIAKMQDSETSPFILVKTE